MYNRHPILRNIWTAPKGRVQESALTRHIPLASQQTLKIISGRVTADPPLGDDFHNHILHYNKSVWIYCTDVEVEYRTLKM